MSKKKEGKRKENDPVLFFRVSLPETKTELCHSGPLQLGSSFFPLFYDIFNCFWNPNSGLQARCETCRSYWYTKHVNSSCGYFFQATADLCSIVLWPYS